jgi:hypothetical protein
VPYKSREDREKEAAAGGEAPQRREKRVPGYMQPKHKAAIPTEVPAVPRPTGRYTNPIPRCALTFPPLLALGLCIGLQQQSRASPPHKAARTWVRPPWMTTVRSPRKLRATVPRSDIRLLQHLASSALVWSGGGS